MSDSLGGIADAPTGEIQQPATSTTYRFSHGARGPELLTERADGGMRRQLLLGRIGAGRLDQAFVGTELDPDGAPTGRLSFLPIERLTHGGLALAPFEQSAHAAGFDQPITAACLRCHTSADARAYPRNALGTDAFSRLSPLDCSSCHGETSRHVALMEDRQRSDDGDLGLLRWAELPAATQRDVCASCHLEGEAHLDLRATPLGLAQIRGPQSEPLPSARPTLVPARALDDFRFVSQSERLVLSACFRAAPSMTCTSCHAPHDSVAAQGPESFDRACLACHITDSATAATGGCSRPADLTVQAVTGAEARSAEGCSDCHMRRSQPFDLPGVVSVDHWIRRRPPPPSRRPMRHVADPGGALALFDDGRLAPALQSPAGRRWADELIAFGLFRQERGEEAAQQLPRNMDAHADAAPDAAAAGLPSLSASAEALHLRALIHESAGELDEARRTWDRALAIDPAHPEARLDRAALRLLQSDVAGALSDAAELLRLHPQAEKAWNLRAHAALAGGDVRAAAEALMNSAVLWPSDAAVWQELGRLLLLLDEDGLARQALERAAALEPSRPGLAEALASLPP
ncbi:MAG: tetratricopeptide repeat protein [Planctomycetota bacterium]